MQRAYRVENREKQLIISVGYLILFFILFLLVFGYQWVLRQNPYDKILQPI
ncbi:MAG: hypothetical protein AAGJ08_03100 [Cyanobacteria bacterium P01_H01_bin.35]